MKATRDVLNEVADGLRKLAFERQTQLEEYRKQTGPQSWGDFPSDSVAALRVGYLSGLWETVKRLDKAAARFPKGKA